MNKILFYGGGNIAQAIISGLLSAGFNKKLISFVDRNDSNRSKLSELGIKERNLKDKIDLIILCVKPKDISLALKEISSDFNNPKVLSLVAGVSSRKYLTAVHNIKLIRGMPNTSSEFRMGITALLNINASKKLYKDTKTLFKLVGITLDLKSENQINDFTGLIGSGPAYFFYILKSYEKLLLKMADGDEGLVKSIMANLMNGVGESVKGKESLDELISAVASKKGTTEAGINSMKSEKITVSFNRSLKAAMKRAKEIADES